MTAPRQHSHKDLILWQKAMALAVAMHRHCKLLPRHEIFGLASQMGRASVSVASNVAEGAARHTTREFLAFLYIARGSCAELETQLLLVAELGYLSRSDVNRLLEDCHEVGRLLNALLSALQRRLAKSPSQPTNR